MRKWSEALYILSRTEKGLSRSVIPHAIPNISTEEMLLISNIWVAE